MNRKKAGQSLVLSQKCYKKTQYKKIRQEQFPILQGIQ